LNNSLKHLAIILDGNKRWAEQNNKNLFQGYEAGFNKIFEIVEWCIDNKIIFLTLFALSSENVKRNNINILFSLINEKNENFKKLLNNKKVKIKFIGDLDQINPKKRLLFKKLEKSTNENKFLYVNVAFNYGFQYELYSLFSKINKKNINLIKKMFLDNSFKKKLLLGFAPEPDLLIRTGGYKRLSNFLLLYLSYTELFFTKTLWPNFKRKEFNEIIENYKKIKRNHGL